MLNVDGLVSGLDTSGIIEQILSLERRPINLVLGQVETARQRQTAFLDLSARFLNVQVTSRRLGDPSTFSAVQVASSNADVLVASASAGVPPGSYSFRVAQLASASQHISGGFATADETLVGAGTLSLELGGGSVAVETELDALNGGQGVTRGSIRITDAAGASAVVDLSDAITVADVLGKINETVGVQASAAVGSDGRSLVLTDGSGGVGELVVEEVSGLDTAADLGVLGTSTGGVLQGSTVRGISNDTLLSTLGDGLGVRIQAGDDLQITDKAGFGHAIDLDGVTTVQGLIQAFATETSGDVTLSIGASGDGFVVTDNTGGGGNLVIANGLQLDASAAADLGIEEAGTAASTIQGATVLAGIDDVLLGTLNGGVDYTGGSIDIQDRSGTITNVDLSTVTSLQDVLRAINASGAAVTAKVNPEGNGILLRDDSGGSGTFSVAESGGTVAAQLGILAAVDDDEINGTDLDPRYIHANTRLDSLNGGQGVGAGKIRITDTNGVSFTVDLGQEETIGDVVQDIRGAASQALSALTVSYNAAGNGLLLTDSSGGASLLRVEEVSGGTTARDLHILGTADTPGVIDGAFQETITISATDTLDDVLQAVRDLNIDVSASVVNDGSSFAPFRLNLVSGVSGSRARLLVDTEGGTNLSFSRTARARDGVVFYGETGTSSESILIRSGDNTYRNIVDGLTVTALQTSSAPVQVTVQTDNERIRESVQELVEKLNAALEEIRGLTNFNLETEQRGVLLGDGTVRGLQRTVLRSLTAPLVGLDNELTTLSQVGIRVSSGRLTLDAAELDAALAENPDALRQLFTARRPLAEDVRLDDFNDGNGVDTDTAGAEFQVTLRDGTQVDVDLQGAVFARDVIDAINSAGGASGLSAALDSGSNAIVLTDTTTGPSVFRVSALNSSSAANDLGLNSGADVTGGDTITGFEIDLIGDVGVMARLTDAIEEAVKPDGSLQRRADGFDQKIGDLEERIERLEGRVARREDLLRRQFAQLEQVLSASQSTLARLTAQLGGLGGS